MKLLERENAEVVIAGETIYMPVSSFSLGSKNMVERRKGVVYYNTGSQSICFCYGAVTESTMVNQIAEVLEDNLPGMVELGRVVYAEIINCRDPRIVTLTIRRMGDDLILSPMTKKVALAPPAETFDGDWMSAKALVDEQCARLRLPEEPDDIKKAWLGAVTAHAAGEGSPFQAFVFLQGFLSTLGPHVFARLLAVSKYAEMTLPLMVRQTREFLVETFDHFESLGDLGLGIIANLGRVYSYALGQLGTLEEYRQLTDSMRSLIQLHYRCLHLIFPWYLEDQFLAQSRLFYISAHRT
ncbi:hypothetical protein Hte_004792 [Hypoxylon texense]